MKSCDPRIALALALALAGLPLTSARRSVSAASVQPTTVGHVVTMLEAMLEKSKKDGDTDHEIYAKFKCYCDTNEQEKTEELAALSKDISILESKIESLKGLNAELSSACAKLTADLGSLKLALAQAQSLRDGEAAAYQRTKSDLETAIGQMTDSLDVLAAVGADQTLEDAAADHQKFMAGFKGASLLKLQDRVKEALSAASAFLPEKQAHAVESFLQKPFTGIYTTQSGEVVGILKNMRDTFKSNLADATATEEKQLEAFTKYKAVSVASINEMGKLYNEKQASLSESDGAIGASHLQLKETLTQQFVSTEFLEQMRPVCQAKAKEYDERTMLRSSEEAAISEAIAILNRDASFELFGKVGVGGGFVQLRSVHRHLARDAPTRHAALHLLEKAGTRSSRLARVMALLEAGNPFDTVLAEIGKMLETISKEGELDQKEFDWCADEVSQTKTTIADAGMLIEALKADIQSLKDEIELPETGLKALIQKTEKGLEENSQSQRAQTEMRTKDNVAYQANVADLVRATHLLSSAINVLTKYYSQLSEYALSRRERVETFAGETKARPKTWEKEKGYKGQSDNGNKVLDMLRFIQTETEKAEAMAHEDENEAQVAFEDSMAELKKGETKMQMSLAYLEETLAQKEQELLQKTKDLKDTIATHESAQAYLDQITPGCSFITDNLKDRNSRRAEESGALTKAALLLKSTPIYKATKAEEHLKALGECREICVATSELHVKCKACLAKVSIPGYCAGHPDTEGC
mmetsp:Transcript_75948/g.176166  ORF Transcript_75948/g.176166 Transcript_75948/m.176166 type:complete len:756 (+) Transcript_75948:74-2341(+)|eukprot:CAMPEP_0171103820 /NCGR_PEP_ID=MMETSP0766_2-20121228/59449_1 /TAXON_ID=439317 /ORGANISM="Gambierdiscus australes, Strain CAWD 149" /LENGTH=755 /DNA_ID=CAMNT_0011564319 /DNA_START=65 /DNA_END=2332 /DNA_ORIENTATION=+